MQETAVRFAICDDDKVYAEKMKALILQTFHLPQPVECIIYLNQEQIFVCRPLGFIRKSHMKDDLQIAGQEIRRFIGQKYSRFVFGGGAAVVEEWFI